MDDVISHGCVCLFLTPLLQSCHATQASCAHVSLSAPGSCAKKHWRLPHEEFRLSATTAAAASSGGPQLGPGSAPVPGPALRLQRAQHALLPSASRLLARRTSRRISRRHRQPAPGPPQGFIACQSRSGAPFRVLEEPGQIQWHQFSRARLLRSLFQRGS